MNFVERKEEKIVSSIDELVHETESEYPEWNADLVVPRELWKEPLKWMIHILKQKNCDRPDNLCLHGNTDIGKTTFLDHVVPSLRRKLNLDAFGIIQVSCLTNTTLKGLYQSILDALDWRYPRHITIQELEILVGRATVKRSCKLIIIDEFSQLEDKSDYSRQAEVLKALRNVPKQTYRPLMIVGVRKIVDLLKRDPETNNRFFKIEFPKFELLPSKLEYFRRLLKALDNQLITSTDIKSNFAEDPCAIYKLFTLSKGKTGSLIKLYEWTVRIGLFKNIKQLTTNEIKEAEDLLQTNKLLDDEDEIKVYIPPEWEEIC